VSIWVLRGLRDGIVTTSWPLRPDQYAQSWRGPVTVRPDAVRPEAVLPETVLPETALPGALPAATLAPDGAGAAAALAGGAELERLCPTGAIEVIGRPGAGQLSVDQGRCVLCGRCVAARPDLFAWSPGATGPAAAALARRALVVPAEPETDAAVAGVRAALDRKSVV
jgi:ferredoxin